MKGNLQCIFGVFGLGLLCLLEICFQTKSCHMENQGDTQALSSRNTMMRSVARILRTQRKPREMRQKASKACPSGSSSAMFYYGLFLFGMCFSNLDLQNNMFFDPVLEYSIYFALNIPSPALPAGYRIWINGLFMWHKSHPELSLHFLQTATQWCGSKQIELSNPAYTLCRAVRELGIRDLTLPLAKGLLGVLDTETRPQKCMSVLSLVKTCQAIYRHLDIKVVFKLLESMMSWKDQKVRMEAICMVATVLEAILMDDEAFARACRRFTSMENADKKGNMDEAAAEKKKLIGLLKDSKLRS